MLTDEELIALYFARSENAIKETAVKYTAGCSRIAQNILHNAGDAEESVNDTWLAVWNAIPPHKPNPLRAYLYRIVRNIAVAKLQKRGAQKRGGDSYEAALDELSGCLSSPDSVENSLSEKELSRLLNAFLAELERDSRILFVRRYFYGDSVRNLAAQLGEKPNTVSVRLSRLREKLRKVLEKEGVFL